MKMPDPMKAVRPAGKAEPAKSVKGPMGATRAAMVSKPTWPDGPPRPTLTRGKTTFAAFDPGSAKP